MADRIHEVLRHLRNTVQLQNETGLTDRQLLGRFLEQRDEAAVAALMRRHGPMVWGVCRRVLRNHHDAEDAFQATFLVLARNAGSIRPRDMVGNWLYGVAHKTAVKARALLAKRRARESPVKDMPESEVPPEGVWRDLQAVLDQELSGLPDKYRVAIVQCDLEGRTRKEAARQLGLPEGTLAGRLTRGRALLARRLARHGPVLSAGALGAVLSEKAAATCVPAMVLASTIKTVTLIAVGQAAAAGVISGNVAALTKGVLTSMLLTKLKTGAALSLLVCLLGTGLGASMLAGQGQPADGQEPPAKRAGDAANPPAGDKAAARDKKQIQAAVREAYIRELEEEIQALTNRLRNLEKKLVAAKHLPVDEAQPKADKVAIREEVIQRRFRELEMENQVLAKEMDVLRKGLQSAKEDMRTLAERLDGSQKKFQAAAPAERQMETRVISLDGWLNTSAKDVVIALDQLFNSAGQRKTVHIAVLPGADGVVVRGSSADIDAVAVMIDHLQKHAAENLKRIQKAPPAAGN